MDSYGYNNTLNTVVLQNKHACINIAQYLSDHTISNSIDHLQISQYYLSLISNNNFLMTETIKSIIGISYDNLYPFIIMPVGTRTYFDSANINRPDQTNLIYLPINNNDKKEHSLAAHEFKHYVLTALPGFKGCAYFDEISENEYNKAAKETILNVLHKIFSIENANDVINNEQINIKTLGSFFIENTYASLFAHLGNPDDELLIELLVKKQIIGDMSLPILNKKILLDNYLHSYMKQKNISQDEGYVIARIVEFLQRSDNELCSELIVRLEELEAYGINSEVLELLQPLREYSTKYNSPKMQEVIEALPVPFCDQVKSYEAMPSEDAAADLYHTELAGNAAVDHQEL